MGQDSSVALYVFTISHHGKICKIVFVAFCDVSYRVIVFSKFGRSTFFALMLSGLFQSTRFCSLCVFLRMGKNKYCLDQRQIC